MPVVRVVSQKDQGTLANDDDDQQRYDNDMMAMATGYKLGVDGSRTINNVLAAETVVRCSVRYCGMTITHKSWPDGRN